MRALLWDVDGTLAETERDGHLVAFNCAFQSLRMPWRWSEQRYGELLAVAGGYERLLHDMALRQEAPAAARQRARLARALHLHKNRIYERIVRRGDLPLRAGVRELLADCLAARLPMAIVTTTGRANVAALLERHLGVQWHSRFAAVACAELAPAKKPDPQAYLVALNALRLSAQDVVAIEDSPAGLEAARRAGVPVLLTRSRFFRDCSAAGALSAGPSLASCAGWYPRAEPHAARITLAQIERWHAQRACAR